MNGHYSASDGQSITYIQYIQPSSSSNVLEQVNLLKTSYGFKEETDNETMDDCIEEHYLEEPSMENTVEVLESVVISRKRPTKGNRKLVQLSDSEAKNQKGRKRIVADQTRAIRKIRANTNKPYVNAKGVEVQPKEFDEEFICTCPKKCTDPKKLSLKTRRQIFNMFWSIGSYEGRCAFLNSCVNEIPKKRTYTKNKEESRRKNTRKYYLKGVEVCKTTFTKTLMISNSRIDVSLQKMESENFSDERGKRKTGSKAFPDEKKEQVIRHIKHNYTPESSL